MLELSLLANIVLVVALLFLFAKARVKIIEEKCSTFAGCLAAITSGLALEDVERRFAAVSHGMSVLFKRTDEGEAETNFYLTRASMLRMFRKAALADVGEHLRLLALQNAGEDDKPGNEMLEYISRAQGADKEPREIWGDEQLAAANFVAERKVLNIYRAQITSVPMKIFKS